MSQTTETCFSLNNPKNSLENTEHIVRNRHQSTKSKSLLMKYYQLQLQQYK